MIAFLCGALVCIITFAVFWPTMHNEFVNWDDDKTIVENPQFRGLTGENLQWMFTTHHTGHWQPLSWITLALNAEWAQSAYGNPIDPRPYHLTNNFIHMFNALLVYLLALRLLRIAARPHETDSQSSIALPLAAAFAALLFSVHPLRVESVAWATERRDVLSAMFFLGTLLCYLQAVAANAHSSQSRARFFYILSIALAALGLLAKSIGVVLPAIMLILDVYPLRRLPIDPRRWFDRSVSRVFAEKIPFLILAIVGSLIAVIAQRSAGAMLEIDQLGAGHRVYVMTHGFAFYVLKTVAPWNLSPLYEIPFRFSFADASFIISAVTVAIVTAVTVLLGRRAPTMLAAWAACVVIVLPVSGLFQSGPQLAADRYSYLSCIGFALLVGGAMLHWLNSPPPFRGRTIIACLVASIMIVALSVLTVNQIGIWRDSLSLWNTVIARRPNTSLAYMNRGVVYTHLNNLPQAQADLERSLELWPDEPTAMNNLTSVLSMRGDFVRCEHVARRVIVLRPDSVDGHINLGFALLNLNRIDEAVEQYRTAFALDPSKAPMLLELARSLAERGNQPLAVELVRNVIASQPQNAQAKKLLDSLIRPGAN